MNKQNKSLWNIFDSNIIIDKDRIKLNKPDRIKVFFIKTKNENESIK